MNIAVKYVSYVLKLKPEIRRNPISVFFITRLAHKNCLDISLWRINMYCGDLHGALTFSLVISHYFDARKKKFFK